MKELKKLTTARMLKKFFNSFYTNFSVGSGSVRNVVYGSEILAVLYFYLSPCPLFL